MAISEATKQQLKDYENRIANGGTVISTSGSKTSVSTPGANYNYVYTNNGSTSTNNGSGTGYAGTNSAYGNRETAYTWSDGSTTFSNYTNYRDAAREAGKEGLNLVNATTYESSGQQRANGYPITGGAATTFTSSGYTKSNQTGNAYNNAMSTLGNMRNYFNLGELGQPVDKMNTISAARGIDDVSKASGLLYTGYGYVPAYEGGYDYGKGGNPYEDILNEVQRKYSDYEDMIWEQNKIAVKQGTDRLNAQKREVSKGYEENARQAYANFLKQQHDLPEFLSSQGITGGATETAQLSLQNEYQKSLTDINNSLSTAIYDIDAAIIDLKNSGDLKAAQQVLENSQQALAAYQNIMQKYIDYNYNLKRDVIDDIRYSQNYIDSQSKYQDTVNAREYDRILELVRLGLTPERAAEVLGIGQTQLDLFIKNINDGNALKYQLNQAALEKAVMAINEAGAKSTSSSRASKSVSAKSKADTGGYDFPESYVKNGVKIAGMEEMSLSQAIIAYDEGRGILDVYVNASDGKLYFKKK